MDLFILGILFISFGMPLVEYIIGTLEVFFKLIQTHLALYIAKIEVQIQQLDDELNEENVPKEKIGFKIPEEKDDIYEED